MSTVVGRFESPGQIDAFGEPESDYFAQTFIAAGSALNIVEFKLDWQSGLDAVDFDPLVTEAIFDTNQRLPRSYAVSLSL